VEKEKISETSEFGNHMKEAGRATVKQWKSLFPQEFWDHGRVARRELLLAMRSLVDVAIEHLEPKEEPKKKAKAPRKAKIEVQ
jgi:hypothetical protein